METFKRFTHGNPKVVALTQGAIAGLLMGLFAYSNRASVAQVLATMVASWGVVGWAFWSRHAKWLISFVGWVTILVFAGYPVAAVVNPSDPQPGTVAAVLTVWFLTLTVLSKLTQMNPYIKPVNFAMLATVLTAVIAGVTVGTSGVWVGYVVGVNVLFATGHVRKVHGNAPQTGTQRTLGEVFTAAGGVTVSTHHEDGVSYFVRNGVGYLCWNVSGKGAVAVTETTVRINGSPVTTMLPNMVKLHEKLTQFIPNDGVINLVIVIHNLLLAEPVRIETTLNGNSSPVIVTVIKLTDMPAFVASEKAKGKQSRKWAKSANEFVTFPTGASIREGVAVNIADTFGEYHTTGDSYIIDGERFVNVCTTEEWLESKFEQRPPNSYPIPVNKVAFS